MSGTRRARSRPLLRSAVFALGAGGGLALSGSLLLDATPAWAQPPAAYRGGVAAHPPHAGVHGHAPVRMRPAAAGRGGRAGAQRWSDPVHATRGPQGHGPPTAAATATSPAAPLGVAPAGRVAHIVAGPPTGTASGASPAVGTTGGSTGPTSDGGSPVAAGSGVTRNTRRVPTGSEGVGSSGLLNVVGAPRGRSKTPSKPAAPSASSPPRLPAGPARAVRRSVVGRPERYLAFPLSALTPVGSITPLAPVPGSGSLVPIVGLPVAPAQRFAGRMLRVPGSILDQSWAGESLKDAARLKLPISLLGAIALFMLIQALVDRRDPKVSDAPERPGEDSVGFE